MVESTGLGLVCTVWRSSRICTAALVLSALFFAHTAKACWQDAGEHYSIDPLLLQAVAQVESGGKAQAMNNSHIEKTGSRDIGLMQINSRWLNKISSQGYTEMHLKDPCSSIFIGAWILSDLVKRYGNEWQAVGAYNAACTTLKGKDCDNARSKYAWAVFHQKQKFAAKHAAQHRGNT